MKRRKGRMLVPLILCIFATIIAPTSAKAAQDITCKAACVVEVGTGRILFSKNANAKLPMASTTKIMTALLVIENGDLNKVVTIPEQAVGVEGSSVYLKKGEQFSRKNLLYALMLESGNDVAVALAIDNTGSITSFVAKMNAKAKQMGAVNTHFVNPNGLPANDHYTSAHDLAVISAAALRNKEFSEIVSTKNMVISPQGTGTKRTLVNHNKLLWQLDGCCGVKTGYTKAAGRCLVSAAERDGEKVVAVVLNAPSMWEDATALLEDALKSLSSVTILKGGEAVGKVPVKNGTVPEVQGIVREDVVVHTTKEEQQRIQMDVEVDPNLKAPIAKGDVVGRLVVKLDGAEIGTAELVSDQDVKQNTYLYQLKRLIRVWTYGLP